MILKVLPVTIIFKMKAHKIHVVRFYKPRPKAGHTCAYSEERKLLAVSRENGGIEIYNFSNPNAPLLQTSIPPSGSELDRSVEALAFVPDGRLFSVGLHGFVFQHFVCQNIVGNPTVPEFWPVTSGLLVVVHIFFCSVLVEKLNSLLC